MPRRDLEDLRFPATQLFRQAHLIRQCSPILGDFSSICAAALTGSLPKLRPCNLFATFYQLNYLWSRELLDPIDATDLTYPPYELPLLSAYSSRFESAYVMLHPFMMDHEALSDRVGAYPKGRAALACQKLRWSTVANQTALDSYSLINHGLLSIIHSLRTEFMNKEAQSAIERFLDQEASVCMPPEGMFPELLHADIIAAFEQAGVDRAIFVPEFPDLDSIQESSVEDLRASTLPFPHRGTLADSAGKLLFTVDWDSFFTLFYGPAALVSDIVSAQDIEGFFATASTTHNWWAESVPVTKNDSKH